MSRSPTENPEITLRARKILQAVVSEYLNTGEAVGSRTVTRRHPMGLSAATVRNVMADLEDLGLLDQPHTSAGRVPTRTGLRFFIDSLLKVRTLSAKEQQEIRLRCGVDRLDMGEVVRRTSQTLAEVTPHAGIVITPRRTEAPLRHLEFVPLRDKRYLCVLVCEDEFIENRVIEIETEIDSRQLHRIHNYLNELLCGLTLPRMRDRLEDEVGQEKNAYDAMTQAALALGQQALAPQESVVDVVVRGQANLLDESTLTDSSALLRTRELLQALEDKELLHQLLGQCSDAAGLQVVLGTETTHRALEDSSLVMTPYGPRDQPIGAIAVIGPMRMNYGKVMSIVDFTADLVSQLMNER